MTKLPSPMDIGDIVVTDESCENPYTWEGEERMGLARSRALGLFLCGGKTPGLVFWYAPSCGGAVRLTVPPDVRQETIDYYWKEDGTPKRV